MAAIPADGPLGEMALREQTEAGLSPAPAEPHPEEEEEEGEQGESPAETGSPAAGESIPVSVEAVAGLSEVTAGLVMDEAAQEERRRELDAIVSGLREVSRQLREREDPEAQPGDPGEELSERLDALLEAATSLREGAERDADARLAIYGDIRRRVADLTATPLEVLFAPLPGAVRELADEAGKRVEVELSGGDVELERASVEDLREVMGQLVANAVYHGIEDPRERQALHKEAVGDIRVRAESCGDEVAITVADDGRGIQADDPEEAAPGGELEAAPEATAVLPYAPLLSLFRADIPAGGEPRPGGAGAAAVREALRRVKGTVRVDSEPGAGAAVTLRIPASRSAQRILKLRIGEEVLGVPASQVEKTMPLGDAGVSEVQGRRHLAYQGEEIPVARLADLWGEPDAPGEPGADSGSPWLVVLHHLGGVFGLIVDEALEVSQGVVRDVPGYLQGRGARGVIGATISGAGEVQLLLEPNAILEMEIERTSQPEVQ